MKPLLLLWSVCLCLCSALVAFPSGVARAASTGTCSPSSSSSFGYVTGSAYTASFQAATIVKANSGRHFLAYLGCDTNQQQAMTSAASFNLWFLGDAGVLQNTVTITKSTDGTAIGVEEKAHIGRISLLGGLIAADFIETSASSQGTAMDAKSANTSSFIGMTVAGIPVQIATRPNTKLGLPGIGLVTLNKQEITNTPDSTAIAVTAIDLQVLDPNAFLPVGVHLQIGHVESTFSRTLPVRAVCAFGYAFNAYSALGPVNASSGPWIPTMIDSSGGHVKDNMVGLSVPLIGHAEAIGMVADGQVTPQGTRASMSGDVGNIYLLGGLIQAETLSMKVEAATSQTAPPTASAHVSSAKLVIAGEVISTNPGVNSTISIPGIGSLVVNEQTITKTPNGISAEVNIFDLRIGSPNSLNLPVGLRIIFGHALACAQKVQA